MKNGFRKFQNMLSKSQSTILDLSKLFWTPSNGFGHGSKCEIYIGQIFFLFQSKVFGPVQSVCTCPKQNWTFSKQFGRVQNIFGFVKGQGKRPRTGPRKKTVIFILKYLQCGLDLRWFYHRLSLKKAICKYYFEFKKEEICISLDMQCRPKLLWLTKVIRRIHSKESQRPKVFFGIYL